MKNTELTKEQMEQIKELKVEKKLLPKAYKEWKTNIKVSIKNIKMDEWKSLVLSLLFEVVIMPLNIVIAFLYAEFQKHGYARKYRKITGKYPSGYMIPDIMMVLSIAILGVLLVDYSTNGKLQKVNSNAVEYMDNITPDETGIVVDPFRIITDKIGYTAYREYGEPKIVNTIRDVSDGSINTPYPCVTTTTEEVEYDNIVTAVSEEYGKGETLREVVQ